MIVFEATPAIPRRDERLRVLSADEIERAVEDGYILNPSDPSTPVSRPGPRDFPDPLRRQDFSDWRTKLYVVWFCYLFENLRVIEKPLGCFEELFWVLRGPRILDLPGAHLAALFAGAGAADPISPSDTDKLLLSLKPHYDLACKILQGLSRLT